MEFTTTVASETVTAENLRSGNVWRWFMANEEIDLGLRRAGMRRVE